MAKVNNRVKVTSDIELKDRLVAINRTAKVTKGGRTFTFSAMVVVGNEDGIVGWGVGKAGEVASAIAKGIDAAKKNLIQVPVYKGPIPPIRPASCRAPICLISIFTLNSAAKTLISCRKSTRSSAM
jgi:small subunit ribosomal protein S5